MELELGADLDRVSSEVSTGEAMEILLCPGNDDPIQMEVMSHQDVVTTLLERLGFTKVCADIFVFLCLCPLTGF